MKSQFLLAALMLFGITALGQSKNSVSFFYAAGSADVNIHGAIGDFGFESQSATAFGLGYTRKINKFFSLETGLEISKSKTRLNTFSTGAKNTFDNQVNLVTVPFHGKFDFLKFFHASVGLDLDLQTNYDGTPGQPSKQSGIGLALGAGAHYNFGALQLFVTPFFQDHNAISFAGKSKQNLISTGVRCGVGYNF